MTNILTSWNCKDECHLVIGSSNAAALRVSAILKAGANPVVVTDNEDISPILSTLKDEHNFNIITSPFNISQITTLGREDTDGIFDKVFVSLPLSKIESKRDIYNTCRRLRIPVNISDSPEFCTFTILSTYTDGDFQMGVTTNGKGCKLASRIKRELSTTLPKNIGDICEKIGALRKKIQLEDECDSLSKRKDIGEDDDDAVNGSKFNSLVEEFNMTQEEKKLQRTKWLSQIVEYYPLQTLGEISIEDLSVEFHKSKMVAKNGTDTTNKRSSGDEQASIKRAKTGKISLVGSGPGAVSLLTVGAIEEIFAADLILADKLVPQQVLDIIPMQRTNLYIAKKFPGNAERAQEELLKLGLEALQKGQRVVRLKQGDPYIFGRGGEEYNFFAENGYKPKVLPGITSALAAPVLTNIPATHREVADQVLICTGTGRRGTLPNLPEFIKSRTTVFLMALHRIVDLIPKLIEEKDWDPKLPVAVIERASCPDQRVIRTTLENVAAAVEANGSRPPGLLVTGYACEVIEKNSAIDEKNKWVVSEGWSNESSFGSLIPLLGKKEEN
ncbi:uroporphyrinogen-III C-methyltransferase [[Candida] railenensis]|uniref:Uroporphyrinogen-III C-methyltransferase n=1 Tax=[Candida] railenensis TaxID=45579 RepID=A0A9P0QQU8_9ASCO|nr:uroporphyrinogen-III C-methyltransferase [[Candida] railenensis]